MAPSAERKELCVTCSHVQHLHVKRGNRTKKWMVISLKPVAFIVFAWSGLVGHENLTSRELAYKCLFRSIPDSRSLKWKPESVIILKQTLTRSSNPQC